MYCVDYRAQALSFFAATAGVDGRRTAPGSSESEAGRWVPLPVETEEPLRAELSAFLAAVRGEAPIFISGHDGLQALAAAEGLVISGREQRAVTVAPVT
jgi:predicted dehydrogenase